MRQGVACYTNAVRIARLIVAVSLTITPRVVLGQASSWHATVNGETAVTDNVFAAGNDGDRNGDLFFQLRPGLARSATRA